VRVNFFEQTSICCPVPVQNWKELVFFTHFKEKTTLIFDTKEEEEEGG
jgi:hypothetical protein